MRRAKPLTLPTCECNFLRMVTRVESTQLRRHRSWLGVQAKFVPGLSCEKQGVRNVSSKYTERNSTQKLKRVSRTVFIQSSHTSEIEIVSKSGLPIESLSSAHFKIQDMNHGTELQVGSGAMLTEHLACQKKMHNVKHVSARDGQRAVQSIDSMPVASLTVMIS